MTRPSRSGPQTSERYWRLRRPTELRRVGGDLVWSDVEQSLEDEAPRWGSDLLDRFSAIARPSGLLTPRAEKAPRPRGTGIDLAADLAVYLGQPLDLSGLLLHRQGFDPERVFAQLRRDQYAAAKAKARAEKVAPPVEDRGGSEPLGAWVALAVRVNAVRAVVAGIAAGRLPHEHDIRALFAPSVPGWRSVAGTAERRRIRGAPDGYTDRVVMLGRVGRLVSKWLRECDLSAEIAVDRDRGLVERVPILSLRAAIVWDLRREAVAPAGPVRVCRWCGVTWRPSHVRARARLYCAACSLVIDVRNSRQPAAAAPARLEVDHADDV